MVCENSTSYQVEKALQRIDSVASNPSPNPTVDAFLRAYNWTQTRLNSNSETEKDLYWGVRLLYILFFDNDYPAIVTVESDVPGLGSWAWSDEEAKYYVSVNSNQDEIIHNHGTKDCNNRADALTSSALSQLIQVYLDCESCNGHCGNSECADEHSQYTRNKGYGDGWYKIAVHIEKTMKQLGWFKPYLNIAEHAEGNVNTAQGSNDDARAGGDATEGKGETAVNDGTTDEATVNVETERQGPTAGGGGMVGGDGTSDK